MVLFIMASSSSSSKQRNDFKHHKCYRATRSLSEKIEGKKEDFYFNSNLKKREGGVRCHTWDSITYIREDGWL